jgi:hypothetical protein
MQNTVNNNFNCSRTCQPTNIYSATIDKNCSTATFTLQNAPDNVSIIWTANLGSPRSGVGTVAIVSAAPGQWINVTFEIYTCNTHRFTTPGAFIGVAPNEARTERNVSYDLCRNGVDYYEYASHYSITSTDPNKTNDDFYWNVSVIDPAGGLINQFTVNGRFHTVNFVNAGVPGTTVNSVAYYNGSCGWVIMGSYFDTFVNDVCVESERRIFPNPASDQLVIDGNNTTAEVIMYNKNSEVVYEGKTQPDQPLNIDTSQFNDDIYYLNIIDKNGVKTQRQIIIKKQR